MGRHGLPSNTLAGPKGRSTASNLVEIGSSKRGPSEPAHLSFYRAGSRSIHLPQSIEERAFERVARGELPAQVLGLLKGDLRLLGLAFGLISPGLVEREARL